MVLPIKRFRPYASTGKPGKKLYDGVILDWEPYNLHRCLQKSFLISKKDYFITTRYEYESDNDGEMSKSIAVYHTVMFRYRKDAKRFANVAAPGKIQILFAFDIIIVYTNSLILDLWEIQNDLG